MIVFVCVVLSNNMGLRLQSRNKGYYRLRLPCLPGPLIAIQGFLFIMGVRPTFCGRNGRPSEATLPPHGIKSSISGELPWNRREGKRFLKLPFAEMNMFYYFPLVSKRIGFTTGNT